ncbi:DegT/DnrJ/EryC1/StrS family aminotransferase [Thalassobacillus hwangdonensis]|uniref:DegT/DnrJ/EryC1/StrS family aminotransferase n=1 Tax=Thalassobacillus hwangdonensis TaxID=546108 RepID=A0ABW3L477_9BACI
MKKKERIYLAPPHMSGRELQYIQEAFRSNWISSMGSNIDEMEKQLAAYTGAKHTLLTSSGTAALHLALRVLEVGQGDTIFCSSLTFVASANAILYQHAIPVFIDSEPDSWNMSPKALERAFEDAEKKGKLPKAVVIVHLYGQSSDMEALQEICNRYQVPIVEDAAESLGATYKGVQSGTLGRIGIYSFNGNKIITTSGGGAIVSEDPDLIEKAKFWANQAKEPALHYQHEEMGFNYRMSNILAGIGRAQLEVLDQRIRKKRRIFERYNASLQSLPGFEFMKEMTYGTSTRWLSALTVDPDVSSSTALEIIKALSDENIESRPVWKPLHLQPLFKGAAYFSHQPEESVSDRLYEHGICLPSGTNLTDAQQDEVIKIIHKVVTST